MSLVALCDYINQPVPNQKLMLINTQRISLFQETAKILEPRIYTMVHVQKFALKKVR